MKKSLILLAVVAGVCLPSLADFYVDSTNDVGEVVYRWQLREITDGSPEQGGVEIVSVSPKPVNDLVDVPFVIPAYFSSPSETHAVKRIGPFALADSLGLVSVKVPPQVISIGDCAFSNCTSLARIDIGYGVRRIGEAPFFNTMIQTLTLPDSLMRIDGSVRRGLANDITFELEDPKTSHYALSEDGVLYRKDFDELVCCPTRQEQVIIPDTVTNIHKEAFCGCFRLQSLLIPENVSTIGDRAFACAEAPYVSPNSDQARSRLEQVVISSRRLDSMGTELFAGCRNLANVYFSGEAISFSNVAANVFSDVGGFAETAPFTVNVNSNLYVALQNAESKDGQKILMDGGTDDDERKIELWDGKRVETYDNLVDVSFSSVDAHGLKWSYRIVGNTAEICNANQDGPAIDPKTRNNTYRYEYDENGTIIASYPVLEIPTMLGGFPVKKLGPHALDGCSGITELKMADTVTEIGEYAFKDCSGLIDIPLTERIQCIGEAPFAGTGITAINIPASVINLKGNIGMGCRNLNTITAKDSAWFTVEGGLLYDSEKTHLYCCPTVKTSVSLPDSLREVGEEAFSGCSRLTIVDLPKTVKTIEAGAFEGCTGLADIALPESLKVLGDGAFKDCSALKTVHFNGNAPTMDSCATLYEGTPEELVAWVAEGSTGWKDASEALPDDAKWPASGVRRAIKRPGGSTTGGDTPSSGGETGGDDDAGTTSGSTTGDDGVEWSYTITDGLVTITSVPTNVAGDVSIPAKLANFPVAGIGADAFTDCADITSITIPARVQTIAPGAFTGCTALESFVVDADNASFKSVSGVLFTKDGKTLVKVPARYTIASETTETRRDYALQTQRVPMQGSTWTVVTGRDLVETVTMKVTPTTSIESLLGGVTNIADYAFTDCGFVTAGQMLDGKVEVTSNGVTTLTLVVNGKSVHAPIVNRQSLQQAYSGRVPAPISIEEINLATTNTVVDADSFWLDSSGYQHEATSSTTTYLTLDRTCVMPFRAPSSVVSIGEHAFDGSGFTEVECPKCAQTPQGPSTSHPSSEPRVVKPIAAFVGASAAVFDGWCLKDGVLVGSVRVKAAKMNAKGEIKLTATVQPLVGKKLSLKGVLGSNGEATLEEARGRRTLTIRLGVDAFTGTFGEMVIEGGRTASAPPASAMKTWGVVLETESATGAGAALANGSTGLSVVIGARGRTKITGSLADGTRVAATAQLVELDDAWYVPVVLPLYRGKAGGFAFLLAVDKAGGMAEVQGLTPWTAFGKQPFVATWAEETRVRVAGTGLKGTNLSFDAELPDGYVLDAVDPWKGWKPRVTAKAGTFRGMFSLYRTVGGRVKKTTVNVAGVVIDGVGYGSALIKDVASIPVVVR